MLTHTVTDTTTLLDLKRDQLMKGVDFATVLSFDSGKKSSRITEILIHNSTSTSEFSLQTSDTTPIMNSWEIVLNYFYF